MAHLEVGLNDVGQHLILLNKSRLKNKEKYRRWKEIGGEKNCHFPFLLLVDLSKLVEIEASPMEK